MYMYNRKFTTNRHLSIANSFRLALFSAAINRASVAILRFPLISNVQLSLRKVSLVYRFKYTFTFFPIFIIVMSVMFLVAVIGIPPNF